MENKETFGDGWEILDTALKGLSGDLDVAPGSVSFPIMDPPKDKEGDDIEEKTPNEEDTDSFKDERTIKDDTIIKTEEDEIKDEVSEEKDESSLEEENSEDDLVDESSEIKKDDIVDFGEFEADLAAVVQERLFEEMGWEFEDKDNKFESVADAVSYMKQIIETNSTPEFASKEINDLNKFVQDGGNLKDYFDIQGDLDLDNINLEQDHNQRLVVRETLKARGLTDSQADKKIKRYEDTGILEDEALESKEFLQKDQKNKADKLLKEQELVRQQVEEEQQKFYKDVESTIDSLVDSDLHGVKVTNALKTKLKNATLKVGADGKTEYQKKYQKDLIKNFIKSAFFTLEEGTIVKDLERQAESKATRNLKKKLETQTKRGKNTGAFEDEDDSITTDHSTLSNAFGSFIKP